MATGAAGWLTDALLGLPLLVVTLWLVRRKAPATGTTAGKERAAEEKTKERFQVDITPLPDFSIEDTEPVKYRPVRWNKHLITMGIRSMPFDSWIQLDQEYKYLQAYRTERAKKYYSEVTETLPGYHAAALEVLQETASFLSIRYPNLFAVERRAYVPADEDTHGDSFVDIDAGSVRVIRNHVTGDVWDLDELAKDPEWNPMEVAGQLAVEDQAILLENPSGEYIFGSGHIGTQGHWRFREKLGCTLHEIHTNGPQEVPGWREVLKKSMERYFQKMVVEKPVERSNYTFQNGPTLVFDQAHRRHSATVHAAAIDPEWQPDEQVLKTAQNMYFRTERQTLRRMPKTRAILFSFRTYLVPILEIAKEPGVAGRAASAIRAWPEATKTYNSAQNYLEPLLELLDRAHQEDIDMGRIKLDERGEEIREVQYPF